MSRILYLDCFSGISGDMFLGALFSLGVKPGSLIEQLKQIIKEEIQIHANETERKGIRAIQVKIKESDRPVNLIEIINSIRKSSLPERCKENSIKAIEFLLQAEKAVHGFHEDYHLHELGTIDTVVDIVGTMLGLELLEIEHIYSSAINTGSGTISTAHGILPVPAPATAEILKGIPIYATDNTGELTTPTGAAIVKTIVRGFGPLPHSSIINIGYGAGTKELPDRANLLRVFLLKSTLYSYNTPLVVETNIDDMNPQIYEYLIDKLFEAGALDVFLTPIIMKKSRPAVKVSVICNEEILPVVSEILFRETTTIGLRYYRTERFVLSRTIKTIDTPLGPVRFKETKIDGKVQLNPEYEDLKRIASEKNIPLKEVFQVVMKFVL